jgi:hypothetical protein
LFRKFNFQEHSVYIIKLCDQTIKSVSHSELIDELNNNNVLELRHEVHDYNVNTEELEQLKAPLAKCDNLIALEVYQFKFHPNAIEITEQLVQATPSLRTLRVSSKDISRKSQENLLDVIRDTKVTTLDFYFKDSELRRRSRRGSFAIYRTVNIGYEGEAISDEIKRSLAEITEQNKQIPYLQNLVLAAIKKHDIDTSDQPPLLLVPKI